MSRTLLQLSPHMPHLRQTRPLTNSKAPQRNHNADIGAIATQTENLAITALEANHYLITILIGRLRAKDIRWYVLRSSFVGPFQYAAALFF